MKKEIEAIVVETQDSNIAKVKVSRHSDCSNCGACPGDNALLLEVNNKIGAAAGQRVLLEVMETNMLKAAFIVYMMPLFAAMVGAYIGYLLYDIIKLSETFSEVIFGILGFALSIVYIRYFDKVEKAKQKIPDIIEILN